HSDKQRVADVWVDKNQSYYASTEQAWHENAALEGIHLALVMFSVPGECYEQSELCELRRLETHAMKGETSPGRTSNNADMRSEDENQQRDSQAKEDPPEPLKQSIIHHRGREACHQSQGTPGKLHGKIACADLSATRTVQHHHPHRQEGCDAEGQD